MINVGWSASYVDVDSVISSDVTSAEMFNEELGWVARVLLSLEITRSSSTDNEDLQGVEGDEEAGDGGQDRVIRFGLTDMIGVKISVMILIVY